jgi:signal transduction histidine kinase/CheY-like chemotaxis protein
MDAEVRPRSPGRARQARRDADGPTVLDTVLDLARACILVFDGRLRLVAANQAARELAGWATQVPIGDHLERLFAASGEVASLADAASTGGSWSGRLRLAAPGGPGGDAVWRASTARDGGEPVLVLTADDEADRLADAGRRARADRLEALGQLSAGISHDFNNVLTAIAGYTAFARDSAPDDSALAADLDQVLAAADRGSSLVRQLVAFSRRQVMRPEVVDLNQVVEGVIPMLGRLLGEGIEIRLDLGPRLGRVLADPGQLEQVLVNLATNARDAMPGGGLLTLETSVVDLGPEYAAAHPGARPGTHAVLAVSDTGTGMDRDTLSRVFEPFFTTKGPELGTGLGLATVHGIVGQLGGHVWAYSEPGRGTTFKVYLPVGGGSTAAPRVAATRTAGGGTETILVVEDSEPIRALAVRVLERLGYRVLQDARPADALRRTPADLSGVDLLLTDMVMPDMTGPELAAVLLDRVPRLRVLCMSGYAEQAAQAQGLGAAVSDFLAKPFDAEELAHAVRGLLDRHR